jgi:hypothetical protein
MIVDYVKDNEKRIAHYHSLVNSLTDVTGIELRHSEFIVNWYLREKLGNAEFSSYDVIRLFRLAKRIYNGEVKVDFENNKIYETRELHIYML